MRQKLANKTIVVTGITSGIGLAIGEQLARGGTRVIGVGRSSQRCKDTVEHLKSLHPQARVECLTADLTIQRQVRAVAAQIRHLIDLDSGDGLDALINNAGTFQYWLTLTPEGFETQWAVNHLAPFLLTCELLPLLQQSTSARVVTVSSGSHYNTQLNWDDIQLFRRYNGLLAYKQTKLANVLFSSELNRQLHVSSRVRAVAADPGLVDTDIGAKSNSIFSRWVWKMRRRGGISASKSAKGIVFLATDPSVEENGSIYWKNERPKAPSKYASNPNHAYRLWDLSEKMCAITPGGYVQ